MDEELYSLNDMFVQDPSWLDANIFKIKHEIIIKDKRFFGYVQIRRRDVQTLFSKNEVLEIADISQKVLYDVAMGERRLLSLINATVSHEMRNPTNSIHVQV